VRKSWRHFSALRGGGNFDCEAKSDNDKGLAPIRPDYERVAAIKPRVELAEAVRARFALHAKIAAE
jgi:hypothetical protein